tara:strand:- start:382 stop:1155 length:774 start_codon:yes stop_codon:yes gene_type:complete
MKKLLIDADMLLFAAVKLCEVEIEWMPDVITTHLPLKEVSLLFDEMVTNKKTQAEADEVILCWTSIDNFRNKVDPSYKANRRATNHRLKPVGFKEARNRMENKYNSECWYRLEADDVLGILQTRDCGKDTVIWSGDKDLNQIPGLHLDNDGNVKTITEPEADVFFYRQVLIGDSVDGFGGCPSIGPKTAEKLIPLKEFTPASAWRTVVSTYKKKDLSEQYALVQARLARILRSTEYSYNDISLWTPPIPVTTVMTKP